MSGEGFGFSIHRTQLQRLSHSGTEPDRFGACSPSGFCFKFLFQSQSACWSSVLKFESQTCLQVLLHDLACPAHISTSGTCQHLVPQAFPYRPDESPQKLCFLLLLLAHLLIYSVRRLTWLWLSHWRFAGQWRWESTGRWPGWPRDGRLTKATKKGWSQKIEQTVTAAMLYYSPPLAACVSFDKVT